MSIKNKTFRQSVTMLDFSAQFLRVWLGIGCNWVLSVALLSLPSTLCAQATARLDSVRVETGNPMTLHLGVDGNEPAKVDLSAWDSLIPREQIIAASAWKQENGQWVQDITFVVFDSAQLELPPLDIVRKDGSTAQTPPLSLMVYPTPIGSSEEIAEIADIHPEDTTWADYWWMYLIILWLIGVAVFWWWAQNRKKNWKGDSRVVIAPPHLLALRKLDALQQKQLWQQGQLKEYYSELTFIGREYLEKRYKIPALESTSDEIFRDLRTTDFPENLHAALREVLQWADLAKFAKAAPPPEFHENALARIRSLIEATVPKPVEEPVKKGT